MAKAWTGGSVPTEWSTAPDAERRLAVQLYRDQCREWRAAWGESAPADIRALFFNRARFDAHASCRP